MLKIETVLLMLAVAMAFICPTLGSSLFEKIENQFSRLADRRRFAVAAVGITALTLRLAVLPMEPIPDPIVHDEFGYLLAADTFAHGRLTNPTPPMWMQFETFSVLMKPTYQCFAQPAQGMILAIGKVIFGHPFWGVWLSVGLMCAAITWMLQGWLSPGWALLGGTLAILRYGVFSYWANSYWGGAVGAIGGALVLGALPRVKDSHHIRDVLLMGVGLAILANSRPYEGVVLGLPIAALLLSWMFGKNHPPFHLILRRVLIPLTLILALTGGWLGYYFWRVTGNPFHMPYQIERETYAAAPYMLWQHPRPEPKYNNAVFKKMYEEDLQGFRTSWSPLSFVAKGVIAWRFFLGPALTLPILMLLFALPYGFSWRNISFPTAFLLLTLIFFAIGSALETYYSPHYSAPVTAAILAVCLIAMRRVRNWSKAGAFLMRAVPLICVCSFAIRAAAGPLHISLGEFYEFAWYQKGSPSFGRELIQRTLEKTPGQHLVLVRYTPRHRPFEEWVYNDADIGNAKVVWAREMNPNQNDALINYFKGRQAWLLEADEQPPKLIPFTGAANDQ